MSARPPADSGPLHHDPPYRARLEGLTPEELQARLLPHLRDTRETRALPPDAVHLASALISLRRSGALTYRTGDHAAQLRRQAPAFDSRRLHIVRYNALPPGCAVLLSGEDTSAVIVHVEICRDPCDSWPAPWYIAALAGYRACRAFGADDLEPLVDPLHSPTRRRW